MIRILYVLDVNGLGIGGPFPEMWAFSADPGDNDKIWEKFKSEVVKREEDIAVFSTSADIPDEETLKEQLLDEFDVQGENTYWNLCTVQMEA